MEDNLLYVLVLSWFYFLWLLRNIGINLGKIASWIHNLQYEIIAELVAQRWLERYSD